MNSFEKLVNFFQKTMQTPAEWGSWHIVSIVLTVLACVLCGFIMRRASLGQLRVFLGIAGGLLMLLEVMRQLVFDMTVIDGTAVWDYQWFLFPFHFCSMAMYVSFISGIVKPSKLQDYLLSFLTSFAILAGFIVMIVPSQVLCHFTYVNVQTMIHHGGMLVIATAILSSGYAKLDFKNILKGTLVFSVCVSLGLIADVVAVKIFKIAETFNMFFISPYFECPMPVFGTIYTLVPYPVFLLIYLAAFFLGTCIVVYLLKLAITLVNKLRKLAKA